MNYMERGKICEVGAIILTYQITQPMAAEILQSATTGKVLNDFVKIWALDQKVRPSTESIIQRATQKIIADGPQI
jgi:hypothetical protein